MAVAMDREPPFQVRCPECERMHYDPAYEQCVECDADLEGARLI